MAKMSVKITLNPSNMFEAKLIERLKGEKNKAGAMKVLCYERLLLQELRQEAVTTTRETTVPETVTKAQSEAILPTVNDIDLVDINRKVDQMFT